MTYEGLQYSGVPSAAPVDYDMRSEWAEQNVR